MNEIFTNTEYWNSINELYNKSKEYLLYIEEYDVDHYTVIQPIKEQRDALDHIMKAYSIGSQINNLSCNVNSLQEDLHRELDKAKGHLTRALNDCADILSIILREKISVYLCDFKYKQIVSVWSNYPKKREFLIDVDEEIAKIRNRGYGIKDDIIDRYDDIIKELLAIYKKISKEIYPKLSE